MGKRKISTVLRRWEQNLARAVSANSADKDASVTPSTKGPPAAQRQVTDPCPPPDYLLRNFGCL